MNILGSLFSRVKFSLVSCFALGVFTLGLAQICEEAALAQDPSAANLQAPVSELDDPLEGFNRGVFWFNDQLYVYILRPVAKGYDAITPNPVQKGVHNFFSNLRYPIFLVSDLFQFKFEQAGEHTLRFLINTTIGIVGVMDVAKDFDLPEHVEDFGTALGYHGVQSGPYIVIPLLGPSNVRDLFGRVIDTFLNPLYYLTYIEEDSVKVPVIVGLKILETTDDVNRAREAIDLVKESSLDPYLYIQSAYNQRRQNLIYDNKPPKPEGEPVSDEPNFDLDESQGVPLIGQ